MAPIFIRESLMGRLIYHLSGRKLLLHREEHADYVIPEKYLLPETRRLGGNKKDGDSDDSMPTVTTATEIRADGKIIVAWDGELDPDNPKNWPARLKVWFLFMIGFLTTTIYIGAAIYIPGIDEVMETYNVGRTVAILPMSLYVFMYGAGPMVWSPLTEYPPIGKLYIYLFTLFMFVIIQIPTALSKNLGLGAFIALRVLGGFFASPALATGGASAGEVMTRSRMPIGIGSWSFLAVCAPNSAPMFGAIFTHFKNVFWAFWFLLILGGFTLVMLVMFMPETSEPTLLYRKAKRLRKVTGNPNIVSEGELAAQSKTTKQIAFETVVRPLQVAIVEPMVLSVNLYIALIYAILYVFFEAYPSILGPRIYGLPLVSQGVAYLSIAAGVAVGYVLYTITIWQTYTKPMERGNKLPPEIFIPATIVSAFVMPIGLYIFAWSATPGTSCAGPLIGAGIFGGGTFVAMQTLFSYLAFSFPRFVASVLASNGLFRAGFACVFPLFANTMYERLGPQKFPVGWGCTILAIAATVMIAIPVAFWKYGVQLRGRSQFAN